MTKDDIQYFERRRQECVERATVTDDPNLVAIYRSFAAQYLRALQEHRAANDDKAA